jgi:hypothetical protein
MAAVDLAYRVTAAHYDPEVRTFSLIDENGIDDPMVPGSCC